jgi:hypothetical protein
MKLVINHLTRMAPGFVCVAGIDTETGRHVRPICNRAMLPLRWAVDGHSPFQIGGIVDLGPVKFQGSPPEVEDYHFHEHILRRTGRLEAGGFWALLEGHTSTRLQHVFGPDLRLDGSSCVMAIGRGLASLGCVLPSCIHELSINERGGVRLVFDIGRAKLDLSVSDLRFYQLQAATATWVPDRNRVASAAYALDTGVPCILSVGLTRAFQRSNRDEKRHWLQVNNVHLQDDPLGDLKATVDGL